MSNWIKVKTENITIDKDDLSILISDEIVDSIDIYYNQGRTYLDIPVEYIIQLLKSIGYEVI